MAYKWWPRLTRYVWWHWHVSEQTRFQRIYRLLMASSLVCIFLWNERKRWRTMSLPSEEVGTGACSRMLLKMGKLAIFFFFLSFLLQNVFLFTEVEWHFGSWLSKSARRNKRVLVIAEQTVEVCNRRPPPILFSFFLLSLSTNEAVVKTKSAT